MRTRMRWHGERVKRLADEGCEGGVESASDHVFQASQQLVPLESGRLMRSGKVTQTGKSAVISYDTVYACRQHEELTWRHSPGRSAKYLEIPMTMEISTVRGLYATAIRKKLR